MTPPLLFSFLPSLRYSRGNNDRRIDREILPRYIIIYKQYVDNLKYSQRLAWIPSRRLARRVTRFWEKSFNIKKNMSGGIYVYRISYICRSIEFEIVVCFTFALFHSFLILGKWSIDATCLTQFPMDSARKSVHFLKSHFPFHKMCGSDGWIVFKARARYGTVRERWVIHDRTYVTLRAYTYVRSIAFCYIFSFISGVPTIKPDMRQCVIYTMNNSMAEPVESKCRSLFIYPSHGVWSKPPQLPLSTCSL